MVLSFVLYWEVLMKNVFTALVLCLITVAQPAAVPDVQSIVAEEVKKDGILLVRNDVSDAYEVRTFDIGKILLCLTQDFTAASIYVVTESTFPRGEPAVLVRCSNGIFDIAKGYI